MLQRNQRRYHVKSNNNNDSQPRLTPRGSLLEYCVDSRSLAAHRAVTSSSRATFKFLLFLGPPTYVGTNADHIVRNGGDISIVCYVYLNVHIYGPDDVQNIRPL
jgi:hypothetical protein